MCVFCALKVVSMKKSIALHIITIFIVTWNMMVIYCSIIPSNSEVKNSADAFPDWLGVKTFPTAVQSGYVWYCMDFMSICWLLSLIFLYMLCCLIFVISELKSIAVHIIPIFNVTWCMMVIQCSIIPHDTSYKIVQTRPPTVQVSKPLLRQDETAMFGTAWICCQYVDC